MFCIASICDEVARGILHDYIYEGITYQGIFSGTASKTLLHTITYVPTRSFNTTQMSKFPPELYS